VREALHGFDLVVAYCAQRTLLERLGDLSRQMLSRPPEPVGAHASRWLADALAPVTAIDDALPPRFQPSADEDQAADEVAASLRLRPGFLAVHAGSGSAHKNWPAERFAAVARACARGGPWLVVRGPADGASAAALRDAPGAVVADGIPLRVLGTLLGRAGVYVGNDSGVTHLAAAFGAPTLALFGPTDPAVWSPVGEEVRTLRSPTGAMADLPVEPAIAVLERLRRT